MYFIFKVSYLKHSIRLGRYATKPIENNNKIIMVSDIPTKYNNDNNINLRILVNGDKEDRLLFYTVDEFRRQVIIPSNEWGRMTFKSH